MNHDACDKRLADLEAEIRALNTENRNLRADLVTARTAARKLMAWLPEGRKPPAFTSDEHAWLVSVASAPTTPEDP